MTNRREFIKKNTLGAGLITIGGMGFTAKSYSSIIGANERINIAVIGIRNQGTAHIKNYCVLKKEKSVWLTTLCDTDEQFFADKVKTVKEHGRPLFLCTPSPGKYILPA